MNNKYINIFLFFLILNSADLKALNKTQIPIAKSELTSDSLRIRHLNSRLSEIQSMNKKGIEFQRKNQVKERGKNHTQGTENTCRQRHIHIRRCINRYLHTLDHTTLINNKINKMGTEKIVVGVIVGLAAGALLGVLFAPDKGSETRKKIAKKSTDTVDGIKRKIEEMIETLTEKLEDVKEESASLLKSAGNKTDEAKRNLEGKLNNSQA